MPKLTAFGLRTRLDAGTGQARLHGHPWLRLPGSRGPKLALASAWLALTDVARRNADGETFFHNSAEVRRLSAHETMNDWMLKHQFTELPAPEAVRWLARQFRMSFADHPNSGAAAHHAIKFNLHHLIGAGQYDESPYRASCTCVRFAEPAAIV